jgi:hypothetical protein
VGGVLNFKIHSGYTLTLVNQLTHVAHVAGAANYRQKPGMIFA